MPSALDTECMAPEEVVALFRICEAYYLPAWCSIADYERLMRDQGMQARCPPLRLCCILHCWHSALSARRKGAPC